MTDTTAAPASFQAVIRDGRDLTDVLQALGAHIIPAEDGNASATLTHIAPLAQAGTGAFAFLSNPSLAQQLQHCQASLLALNPEGHAAWLAQATRCPHTVIALHPQPYVLYAAVAQNLYAWQAPSTSSIHPSAWVHPDAQIGAHVVIGAQVSVEAGAVIGAGVCLEAGVRIGAHVEIGAGSHLYPNAVVYAHCQMGARCVIHAGAVIGSDGFGFAPTPDNWFKIPQVGRVIIGDDVEIGANTTIDRGALTDTVIHNDVKMDNLVHIAHNCVIGAHTAIAACAAFAGSTLIGERRQIGGGAKFAGHLRVADGSLISGGTDIISDITTAGQYTGIFPSSSHRDWGKTAALIGQLPEMRRRLRALERALPAKTD